MVRVIACSEETGCSPAGWASGSMLFQKWMQAALCAASVHVQLVGCGVSSFPMLKGIFSQHTTTSTCFQIFWYCFLAVDSGTSSACSSQHWKCACFEFQRVCLFTVHCEELKWGVVSNYYLSLEKGNNKREREGDLHGRCFTENKYSYWYCAFV